MPEKLAARVPAPFDIQAAVDPTYFETFGMSLIEGRAFTVPDMRGTRLVAVVNATVAANFWQGESPLGRQLFVGDSIGTGDGSQ